MGRVVMVSVTLSLTTENTETATVTTTLVNSCVAGTFTECTTSTEAASSRALDHHNKKGRELFPDAIVTKSNGNTVDISTILPSRVEPQGRSDIDALLDMDGVVGKTMQSGSMTWSEMEMMSPMKPACGRSDIDTFLDMDGVVGKTMQSGSMTWSEMEMMSPMKPACGRSGKDRRPR